MSDSWAIDLGTTNTGVALWDPESGQPELVELPTISRRPSASNPLEAPHMIPSSVHMLPRTGIVNRIGAWPPVGRRFFLGKSALIGQTAVEHNQGVAGPAFVPTFKHALGREALRPVARVGKGIFTARQVAAAFLRELLAEVKRNTGKRVRNLVMTVPVSAFENYRAELRQIANRLGVRRVRFIDEPVAAALGYGLSLARERTILVVDIGGGTMHLALVRLTPAGAMSGQAEVLGKQVRPFGGNAVDGWLLADACKRAGWHLPDSAEDEESRFWRRLMLAEACRVKEALFFSDSAAFHVTPPGWTRVSRQAPGAELVTLSRDRLVEILTSNGFYSAIEGCVEGTLGRDPGHLVPTEEVDEVLMVGGSTLLPAVVQLFERQFERRRMRAWHPFEAVALGAATFAEDRFFQTDFIVHDYAFVTHDPTTAEPQYTVVVPRGTRFPTRKDLWKRQVVPTCSLGEPERLFKLVICEIARGDGERRQFVWDAGGDLHTVGGDNPTDSRVVVPLNDGSPTLGFLNPPHQPGDRRPRLEVCFGVSQNRWLVATVTDLYSGKQLMSGEPVVRLV